MGNSRGCELPIQHVEGMDGCQSLLHDCSSYLQYHNVLCQVFFCNESETDKSDHNNCKKHSLFGLNSVLILALFPTILDPYEQKCIIRFPSFLFDTRITRLILRIHLIHINPRAKEYG